MTPADDLFSRAVIGSVVVFALLATVHFLLPARSSCELPSRGATWRSRCLSLARRTGWQPGTSSMPSSRRGRISP